MAMNVQAIPNLSDRVNQIRLETARIINEEILPNENELWHVRTPDGQVDEAKKARSKELKEQNNEEDEAVKEEEGKKEE